MSFVPTRFAYKKEKKNKENVFCNTLLYNNRILYSCLKHINLHEHEKPILQSAKQRRKHKQNLTKKYWF